MKHDGDCQYEASNGVVPCTCNAFYEPPDDRAGTVFDPHDGTFGPIMAAIQAGEFAEAAALLYAAEHPGRRLAVLTYDVTGFTDPEVGSLILHASVQGEANKDAWPDAEGHDGTYPDCHGVTDRVVGPHA